MESSNIVPFAALIVAAVVIVVILLRVMRARQRKADALPHPDKPLTVDEEQYLDSSHIISSGDPRHPDPSARAAGALRGSRDKPRS